MKNEYDHLCNQMNVNKNNYEIKMNSIHQNYIQNDENMRKLENKMKIIKNDHANAINELNQYKKKYDDTTIEINALNNIINRNKEEINDLKSSNKSNSKSLLLINNEKAILEKEIIEISNNLNRIMEEKENDFIENKNNIYAIKQLKEQVHTMTERSNELEMEIKHSREENLNLRKWNSSNKNNASGAIDDDEYKKLKIQNENDDKKIKLLVDENTNLSNQLISATTNLSTLRTEYSEMTADRDAAISAREQINHSFGDLTRNNNANEKLISELQSNLLIYEHDTKRHNSEIVMWEQKYNRLNSRLKNEETTNKMNIDNLTKKNITLNSDLEQVVKNDKNRIRELENQIITNDNNLKKEQIKYKELITQKEKLQEELNTIHKQKIIFKEHTKKEDNTLRTKLNACYKELSEKRETLNITKNIVKQANIKMDLIMNDKKNIEMKLNDVSTALQNKESEIIQVRLFVKLCWLGSSFLHFSKIICP